MREESDIRGTVTFSLIYIDMDLHCYTDGAYSPARNKGGIGIVFVRDGEKIYEYSKSITDTTNNKCEILAVIYALNAVSTNFDSITIFTDSQYVIGCASKGWSRHKNKEYWKLYDDVYNKTSKYCPNIKFEWIKGHTGNADYNSKMNDLADNLAVEASKEL